MKNTIYSLMLNDQVVAEVDALARRLGTTRSSLINEILAEYVDYVTPSRRAKDILSMLEQLMITTEMMPFLAPNTRTLSVKSSLQYRYRPTIKYEINLYRNDRNLLGEIDMLFRTQSAELVSEMTDFFRIWKKAENNAEVEYELYDGKFVRTILLPKKDCTSEQLANSLYSYILLFDKMLKGYLSGELSQGDIESKYNEKKEEILI